jgi:hypothetical protein
LSSGNQTNDLTSSSPSSSAADHLEHKPNDCNNNHNSNNAMFKNCFSSPLKTFIALVAVVSGTVALIVAAILLTHAQSPAIKNTTGDGDDSRINVAINSTIGP